MPWGHREHRLSAGKQGGERYPPSGCGRWEPWALGSPGSPTPWGAHTPAPGKLLPKRIGCESGPRHASVQDMQGSGRRQQSPRRGTAGLGTGPPHKQCAARGAADTSARPSRRLMWTRFRRTVSERRRQTLGSSESWPDTGSQRSQWAVVTALPPCWPGALSPGSPTGQLAEPASGSSGSGRGSLAGLWAATRSL